MIYEMNTERATGENQTTMMPQQQGARACSVWDSCQISWLYCNNFWQRDNSTSVVALTAVSLNWSTNLEAQKLLILNVGYLINQSSQNMRR